MIEYLMIIIYAIGVLAMWALAKIHSFLVDEEWGIFEYSACAICSVFSWAMALPYLIFMLYDLVKKKGIELPNPERSVATKD